MIYGITGHQERDGIDWAWVRRQVRLELSSSRLPLRGLSSLARGADQLFAEEVVRLDGALTAIIPKPGYEAYFKGDDLLVYRRLLAVADVVRMPAVADDETAFLAAGLRVADHCDVLIAVWDGEAAQGRGGTADIVDHAKAIGRQVVHLQPVEREIFRF